jgi:hypothetical protein
MIDGLKVYRNLTNRSGKAPERDQILILNRAADGIDHEPAVLQFGRPKLVLTSPPYPGVHVLYHRWQILGRKETPAPFWISSTLDGNGTSYYTFGDRKQPNLESYFETAQRSFGSIAKLAARDTLVVQMVAFSKAPWQLPRYLETMQAAGLEEVRLAGISTGDGRLWRFVPNRKWYAEKRRTGDAAREVVLFHRVA